MAGKESVSRRTPKRQYYLLLASPHNSRQLLHDDDGSRLRGLLRQCVMAVGKLNRIIAQVAAF
jgi:hypothetical protein